MTNAPQPPTDAEKLLSVCRAVWPGHKWYESREPRMSGPEIHRDNWNTPGPPQELKVHSLDDLARILRELTLGQVEDFEMEIAQALVDKDRPHPTLGTCLYFAALTAPLPVLLDALYRAVVK